MDTQHALRERGGRSPRLPLLIASILLFACTGDVTGPLTPMPPNPSPPTPTPPSARWEDRAAMPTPRFGHTIAVVDDLLFALGGSGDADDSGVLGTVEVYNPASNAWSIRAPMPTPRSEFSVSVVNGILYAVGGLDARGARLQTVEAYDPATDRWTSKAPLPWPSAYHGSGVLDGVMYIVGGSSDVVAAYDPATDAWATKGSLEGCAYGCVVAVVDRVLYAVTAAGSSRHGPTAIAVASYDPVADFWTPRDEQSTYVGDMRGAAADGRIHVLVSSYEGDTHYLYDPALNAWSESGTKPAMRYSAGVGSLGGILYLIGGIDPASWGAVGINEAYRSADVTPDPDTTPP